LPAARPELAVALAGAFRAGGGITDLAARLGAISLTRGLTYWSTTDQRWKVLVSDAHALTAAEGGQARDDFSAAEILSGAPLHFAQDDTRSSGTNVYRLRTLHAEGDRLVFEMTNLTAIRFGFVTLFGPESLVSVHFLERGAAGTWLYYGLSAVTEGFVGDHDGSFINRQDAFYRFLANESPTARPPLAP
jgi:hypothetical protein